jgi:hypothetical protein
VKEVREVDRMARFAPDCAYDSRMRMAQRVHRNAAQKIQMLLARRIKDVSAAPMRKHDLRSLVCRQQITVRQSDGLGELASFLPLQTVRN